ncbi:hypothetical protein [Tessaracoccus sp. G1721]
MTADHPGYDLLRDGWLPTRGPARLLLAAAVVVGVLIPLALSIMTGSISIPHNDAWSHAVIARTFAETGRIELVGWNRSSLVGQIVVLGPLAGSVVAQHLWVAATAVVGLLATFRLVSARGPETAAAAVALAVAAAPQFGLLATSFMTDVPAYAAVMVALTLADTALSTGRQRVLALSLAVGLWGVTIREQALIAPVAVAATAIWLFHGPARRTAVAQATIAAAALTAFELWRRALPNGDSPRLLFSLAETANGTMGTLLALGLCAAPLVLSSRPNGRWVLALAALPVAALGALRVFQSRSHAIAGNYVTNLGAYPEASPAPRIIMPDALWYSLLAIAVLSAACLSALAMGWVLKLKGRDGSAPLVGQPLIALTLALLLGGTVLQAAIGQWVFGRYMLPAVPLVGILLMRHWARLTVLGWSALALNAGMGLVFTSDALARDAAHWHAAEQLVAGGADASTVNAGLEWVGTHAELPARPDLPARDASVTPRIMGMFPGSRECLVVSANPSLQLPVVDEFEYRRWAVAGDGVLYVYRQDPCS